MASSWTLEGLEERIKAHSNYIDAVTSLIPPKPYFKNDPNKPEEEDEQTYQNRKKRISMQLLEEQKKDAKRLKFDPDNLKTITDIQREQLNKNKEKMKESVMDGASSNSGKEGKLEDGDSSQSRLPITDRLARLRFAKQTSESDAAKKITRKEKNRIRVEKKKKKQLAIKKNLKKPKDYGGKILLNVKSTEQDDVQEQDPNNAERNMRFVKFDFEEKKQKKNINDVHLMNKLQNRAEKIEKLKKVEPEKAAQIHEKEEWSKALQKVQGEKIKDDPKLLKKTIKKNANKKKSSEKAWKERVQTVKNKMQERQEIRTKNIQERINAKKNK
ncbi:9531_t:CDS:2, partial [Acaulospora morrowiae]